MLATTSLPRSNISSRERSSIVSLLTKCGFVFLHNIFKMQQRINTWYSTDEYQYQLSHDIMPHITEIETLTSRLSYVGAAMTDIQIMTKIICTLPPSYRNFATVWEGIPVSERRISLLTSRLLREESNALRWSKGHQDAEDTALFSQNYPAHAGLSSSINSRGSQGGRGRGARRYNSVRYRPYVKCTYCTKDWHTHEECRKRKRNEFAKSNHNDAAAVVFPPVQNLSLRTDRSCQDTSRASQDHSYISNSTCFISRRSQDWFAYSDATKNFQKLFTRRSKYVVRERHRWRKTRCT